MFIESSVEYVYIFRLFADDSIVCVSPDLNEYKFRLFTDDSIVRVSPDLKKTTYLVRFNFRLDKVKIVIQFLCGIELGWMAFQQDMSAYNANPFLGK